MSDFDIEDRFQAALQHAGLTKEAAASVLSDEDGTEEIETVEGEDEEPQADERPAPTSSLSLFQHPEAHPYVLDLLLLKKYGPEWLEWEQLTVALAVQKDFGATLSDSNMQKLQAVKTLHLVDGFWTNWEIFVPVAIALSGAMPDFEVMQIPTVSQCAVAVDIANQIRSNMTWTDEMKTYLEVVHRFDGVFLAIDPLDFVTIDADEYPVDQPAIAARWPEVRKSGVAPTGDTGTDEQLRRLLIIHDTVKESRADLRAQLPLLRHE